MFKFLFFIFILFILLLFLMGFSVLRMFKRAFFGSDKQTKRNSSPYQQQAYRPNQPGGNTYSSANREEPQYAEEAGYNDRPRRPHRKIFDKDDGEYVDFEEIKS